MFVSGPPPSQLRGRIAEWRCAPQTSERLLKGAGPRHRAPRTLTTPSFELYASAEDFPPNVPPDSPAPRRFEADRKTPRTFREARGPAQFERRPRTERRPQTQRGPEQIAATRARGTRLVEAGARGVEALVAAVRAEVVDYDPLNAATAAHQLARLAGTAPGESGAAGAAALEAAGLLEDAFGVEGGPACWRRFSPKNLALFAHGLARLGAGREATLRRVGERLGAFAGDLNPRDAAQLAYAAARWGSASPLRPTLPLLASACAAAVARGECGEHEIANILWSFATLGYRDEALLEAAVERAGPQLAGYSPRALSNVACWARRARTRSRCSPRPSPTPPRPTRRPSSPAGRPPRRRGRRRPRRRRPAPRRLPHPALRRLAPLRRGARAGARPRTVNTIAAGAMGASPRAAPAERAAAARAWAADPLAAATALQALHAVRYDAPEALACLGAAIAAGAARLPPRALSTAAVALACFRAGCGPAGPLEALAAAMAAQAAGAGTQERLGAAYAAAVAGRDDLLALLLRAFAAAPRPGEAAPQWPDGASQAALVAAAVALEAPRLAPLLPPTGPRRPRLGRALRRRPRRRALDAARGGGAGGGGGAGVGLGAAAGGRRAPEHEAAIDGVVVDIAWPPSASPSRSARRGPAPPARPPADPADPPTPPKVDGPSHFLLVTGRYDGPTAAKSRLLARRGWRTLRVSYRAWGRLRSGPSASRTSPPDSPPSSSRAARPPGGPAPPPTPTPRRGPHPSPPGPAPLPPRGRTLPTRGRAASPTPPFPGPRRLPRFVGPAPPRPPAPRRLCRLRRGPC
eukprot:tig00021017_g17197.t1